jgi:response regulator NasT
MKKIYILSNDKAFIRNIDRCLDKIKYNVKEVDIKPTEAYGFICAHPVDFIIVHSSYIDNYYNLFDMLLNAKRCGIIYVSRNLEYGSLFNATNDPRFYMIEPGKEEALNDIITIMSRSINAIDRINEELNKYKDKAEEAKLVSKAKLYLMKEKNISEEEAYKYILKCAMDKRLSKLEVSKIILRGDSI